MCYTWTQLRDSYPVNKIYVRSESDNNTKWVWGQRMVMLLRRPTAYTAVVCVSCIILIVLWVGVTKTDRLSEDRAGINRCEWYAKANTRHGQGKFAITSASSIATTTTTTTTVTMTKWSHTLPITAARSTPPRKFRGNILVIFALLASFQLCVIGSRSPTLFRRTVQLPIHAERSLARCASLKFAAGPPANFHDRKVSDRFVQGTKATLLHNARIWTGENNGTEILRGDVFVDKGIIRSVGDVNLDALGLDLDGMIACGEVDVVDVGGAWVTPGCVSFGFNFCLPRWD